MHDTECNIIKYKLNSGTTSHSNCVLFVSLLRRTSENYVLYYYVKPYTRYGPFLIGILTGIYLTTKKEQLLKTKVRTSDYLPHTTYK